MNYAVVAFYHFCQLENPHQEVENWKQFLGSIEAKGRIYLSYEGVNAQLSVSVAELECLKTWLQEQPLFAATEIKVHHWHAHTFEKLIIKFRQQLVAFDTAVNLESRGEAVDSHRWKEMLEQRDENTVLLDVRNQYEYDIGHFEGAVAPVYNHFRDYKKFAENFCDTHDPEKTKVMMCCTGGIRCEIFSSYLLEKGFKKVYQLHGGIIQYGLDVGSDHWLGKLFVFDDRMAIPISQEPAPIIATCKFCHIPYDDVYNCASTDCNEMFTCCPECLKHYQGCCSSTCCQSSRIRPLEDQNPHKPFRKWHLYREKVTSSDSSALKDAKCALESQATQP